MPYFACKVADAEGKIISLTLSGTDRKTVEKELTEKGYYPLKVKRRYSFSELLYFGKSRIKGEDFLVFNRELLALVEAGLTIVQSLDILIKRREDPFFKGLLEDVKKRVIEGASLSQAFEAQGEVIPRLYISLLLAGERSGDLPGVLRRFIRYQKVLSMLRKRVSSAIVYPIVLIVLATGLITLLVTYVLPRFAQFYADFGAELPLITTILIKTASFISRNFLFILIGILGLIFLLRAWSKTEKGGRRIDGWKLRLPLVGNIWLHYYISQFTRSLSTMLGGGIPLLPSLAVASQSVGNKEVIFRMRRAEERVKEGMSLHQALEETGLISEMALEMIQVGEATGSLVEMLNNIADFYDEEIDYRLGRMLSLLEPALLVAMGLVVAGILISMYFPLFRLAAVAR
ncbi:MAG: type II secretion system F family protein [Acidobacteria bacterium]|nr:type II secretion system F family protein [Acidobacteriota bacterium]